MQAKSLDSEIARRGFAVVPHLASESQIATLLAALEAAQESLRARGNERGVYAMRNVLEIGEVREFAASEAVKNLLSPLLGTETVAVRGILFDKTPRANWKVPWHQDLSIAVRKREKVPGFGPWSQKAGVTHVQPPREILEAMLTLRLHLDPCNRENGPLRVLPGSHLQGKMAPEAIAAFRTHTEPHVCLARRGGALLMRPLLLHASSAAVAPRHRRVLHLEYACQALPGGLEWL